MAVLFDIPYLPSSFSLQFIILGLVSALVYYVRVVLAAERPLKQFPVIALTEDGLDAQDSWFKAGQKTIKKGIETCSGPFQVITGTGPKICLPNRFAEEIKNLDELSLAGAFHKDFFGGYPGFEPFAGLFSHDGRDTSLMPEVVRVKLTQALGLVTEDVVDEATAAIHDIYGEDTEWREINVKFNAARLVARMSSRVFLGKPLCRNPRWLEIQRCYTVDAFTAARTLRQVPSLVRPFLHWFLPACIKLRKDYKDTQDLITPELERRKVRARKAMEAGLKMPKTADTISWMYEIARERREEVNMVNGQLELTLGSNHTTTEGISSALIDIMLHPEIIQPLRDEVIQVIKEDGWMKQSLYKLRLMDSFLKENQRHFPTNTVSMNRWVKKTITLSDGSVLPAGSRLFVANRFFDPTVYPDPEKFDPYRFLRERERTGKSTYQHVTASTDHMAFGYGNHVCPGRFFASNEIKIALAHLLLKYDWKLVDAKMPGRIQFETNIIVNPMCKVLIRRRKEEIAIDLPEPRE